MNPSGGGTTDLIAPEFPDADCFKHMPGTEPSNQGHALHKTGKVIFQTHDKKKAPRQQGAF